MPDIEMYITDVAQDPNEQRWIPDSELAGITKTDDPNDEWQEREAIRNAKGAIEFLDRIVDTVDNFLENDQPIPVKRPKLEAIRTRELGSDKWRGARAPVSTAPVKVVENSTRRRTLKIWNHGPNEVYLSSLAGVAAGPNTIELPPVSATLFPVIELDTRDDVWAVCAAAESAVLSIVQIFDMED